MPGSPVNWSTISSAILWASRRDWSGGTSNFLDAIRRNSGEVRSYRRISPSMRDPRRASSPWTPAWAPAAAKSVHDCLSAAALSAGIAPVAATTLNRPEKVRSAPVMLARSFPVAAGSAPVVTVNSGIAMLSFLVPPPVMLM